MKTPKAVDKIIICKIIQIRININKNSNNNNNNKCSIRTNNFNKII